MTSSLQADLPDLNCPQCEALARAFSREGFFVESHNESSKARECDNCTSMEDLLNREADQVTVALLSLTGTMPDHWRR